MFAAEAEIQKRKQVCCDEFWQKKTVLSILNPICQFLSITKKQLQGKQGKGNALKIWLVNS
jgi:hypothetical protein